MSEESKQELSDKVQRPEQAALLRILSSVASGTVTVNLNNFPFVKIDAEAKTLDVEIKGFEQSGLRVGDIMPQGKGKTNFLDTLKQSSDFARGLHDDGWSIRLFEGEQSLLKMGRGASSLTGYIWLNPLKIPRLMRLI